RLAERLAGRPRGGCRCRARTRRQRPGCPLVAGDAALDGERRRVPAHLRHRHDHRHDRAHRGDGVPGLAPAPLPPRPPGARRLRGRRLDRLRPRVRLRQAVAKPPGMPDPAPATRIETDSMGPIAVRADRYWGAQTERSLHHFAIGDDRMTIVGVRALRLPNTAAALSSRAKRRAPAATRDPALLDARRAELITRAADEVIADALDEHFPLS